MGLFFKNPMITHPLRIKDFLPGRESHVLAFNFGNQA
jgi:hypothetical protein